VPNSKSAEKRVKQSEKRRIKNRGYMKRIKEIQKEIDKSIKANVEKEKVAQLLDKAFKIIDTAQSKGVVHKNYAARKKSQLHRKVKQYLGETKPVSENTVETEVTN
jgi:small subunit ribosomal protein S20